MLWKTGETRPRKSLTTRDNGASIGGATQPAPRHLPALRVTAYRGDITAFLILVLDFRASPRHLTKCETYGVSLVRTASPVCVVGSCLDMLPRFRWISVLRRSLGSCLLDSSQLRADVKYRVGGNHFRLVSLSFHPRTYTDRSFVKLPSCTTWVFRCGQNVSAKRHAGG